MASIARTPPARGGAEEMAQKLERPAMIVLPDAPGHEGWALEGLYRPVEARDACGAVIAPPHPLMGGSMDSSVVSEVAFACDKAGLASLRFNWRGVGASAGQPSGEVADALEDYSAALDFIEESAAAPIVACGYSFGAVAAVAVSDRPTVRRLALVAPPPSYIDVDRLKAFPGKVFMAAGNVDQFVDLAELERIASELKDADLVVLEDTDHFFNMGRGLEVLSSELSDWLAKVF